MENSIEKNLDLLLELQDLDRQLNEIFQIKGGLPQEIKALADEIANFDLQIVTIQGEQKTLEQNITSLQLKLKDIQSVIKRCEAQQMNIRNNREYDAITKEIELHNLDIQLTEKKIREYYEQVERSKGKLLELDKAIEKVQQMLENKEQELQTILCDNKEEAALQKKRQALEVMLDQPLLVLYEKIRNNARNNLAVVLVKRGACGGCFTMVYPQMQAEIKERRQLFKCENCGRILANVVESVTILTPMEEHILD